MAKLCLAFVLVCVSLLLFTISTSGVKPLHKGRIQSILVKLQDEVPAIASSIKNLAITSDTDKAELIIIANQVIHSTHQCVTILNQAALHVQNKQYKRKLGEDVFAFEEAVRDLQRRIYEDDANKVQESLVSFFENQGTNFKKILSTIVEHHTDTESLISDQIREASGLAYYGIVKISFHAAFFTKTNKELGKELESKLAVFETTFDKLKSHNDEATKTELTQLIKILTIIAEEAAVKLENWMNLHTVDDVGFTTIKETSDYISELVGKLHHLVESTKTVAEVVENFKEIQVLAGNQFKKVANIVLKGTPGDQEYVRDLLLAHTAVSSAFSDDINLFLATKHINKFT